MNIYRNPIKRNGDFADPFVLRHDGRYYLYATNPDVRCWSSSDLVNWELEGSTVPESEFPGLVPFAPEVVYADGAFYMYTSPSGLGHYVLRSDSPTGPFRKVSGNVGHAIDGNVLIDDDGAWYFYWAGDEGIWACEMPSPAEFGPAVFTGIHMNGWTEGPFVSKRDGRYHMTLTGNHYLSSGYRINAAVSEHPMTGYRNDPLNPVLVDTEGAKVGLGHSSSVLGPDLVSTYIVYHNLNSDESRDLNIDRQVWNGSNLLVLGPTAEAPVPQLPDDSCDWAVGPDAWAARVGTLEVEEGGGVLAGGTSHVVWLTANVGSDFTAELNLTSSPTSTGYGVTLGRPGDRPDLTLFVNPSENALEALGSENEVQVATSSLPSSFRHDALHAWRLESEGGELRLLLDGRLQLTLPWVPTGDLVLGVCATSGPVRIGFCAVTRSVATVADRTSAKPVPGRFWAGLGVSSATSAPDVAAERDDYTLVVLDQERSLVYDLQVQDAGSYVVYLTGDFGHGDAIGLSIDEGDENEVLVTEASGVLSIPVLLDAPRHSLTLRGLGGVPAIALVTIAPAPRSSDASWRGERLSGFGKRTLSDDVADDFTVSASLRALLTSPDAHADVIFRATHLAEGGEGDDTTLGIDFFLGYSLQFHSDRVVLARHAYDERVLATVPRNPALTVEHSLTLRVVGGAITIELDGTEVAGLVDPLPHLFGRVGIRTSDAELLVESLEFRAPARSELPELVARSNPTSRP